MKTLVYRAYIAGVSYAKPDFDLIRDNDPVILVPDPQNQYDSNAIEVRNEQKFGYIPAESTEVLHNLINRNIEIFAFVRKVAAGKYDKLLLSVYTQLQ